MSDILEFPGGRKREARPAFSLSTLADYAANFGDKQRKSPPDRDMDLAYAAKLESAAQHLRMLAEEARLLNHPRIRWELVMDADRLENRAVELQAEWHNEQV